MAHVMNCRKFTGKAASLLSRLLRLRLAKTIDFVPRGLPFDGEKQALY